MLKAAAFPVCFSLGIQVEPDPAEQLLEISQGARFMSLEGAHPPLGVKQFVIVPRGLGHICLVKLSLQISLFPLQQILV